MIEIANTCEYEIRYGDTGSIFVEFGGKNSIEYINKGTIIKIYERIKWTSFEHIGADIKGNYVSILKLKKEVRDCDLGARTNLDRITQLSE